MDSFDPRIGTVLTLRSMLDGDISLIIPDMQRDYCWDSRRVGGFVGQLVELYGTRGSVTMGLLYGYESPVGSHRLMLIDGQQRITTLYLLLGMLYRRIPEPWLRRLLISDYELSDDRQPRLVYQVRNEAMYFMSDLVTNFFLNRDGRLSRIRESHWYFTSYDSDPTVATALTAIQTIDSVLEKASERPGWDFREFAVYVAEKLLFIYHEIETRAEAERMFITINTTGEPLTMPQMVKTELYQHAIDKDEFARRWGALERWCHLHGDSTDDHPDTGDSVFSAMLTVWKKWIESKGEVVRFDAVTLDSICGFHGLFKRLFAEEPEAGELKPDSDVYLFALLPSIEYISRWGGGVAPLWRMLTNITRYRKISSGGGEIVSAIRLVNGMPDSDIVSMLKVRGNHGKVLTTEETGKLRLLARAGGRRTELAALISRGQAHPLLDGCVMPVVEWCQDKSGSEVNLNLFRHYIDRIYEIWPGDIDCNPDLDLVRRALLTLRHKAYPVARRSGASLSLAWHDYDWQRLMATAPGLIRQLIDRIGTAASVRDAMTRMCEKFSDRSYQWEFMVHGREVMAMCAHRSLMVPCSRFVGMHVAGSEGDTSWYVERHRLKPDLREFLNIHPYGSRCLYTDHRTLNMAVDIYYEPDSRHQYRLEVFARDDDDRRQRRECDIRDIANRVGVGVNFDKSRRRYFAVYDDAGAAVSAFNRLTGSKLMDSVRASASPSRR